MGESYRTNSHLQNKNPLYRSEISIVNLIYVSTTSRKVLAQGPRRVIDIAIFFSTFVSIHSDGLCWIFWRGELRVHPSVLPAPALRGYWPRDSVFWPRADVAPRQGCARSDYIMLVRNKREIFIVFLRVCADSACQLNIAVSAMGFYWDR